MSSKPYDYTQLDKIILFKGTEDGDVIELSRDGRYINLIKPKEIDKRYFRYDLNDKKFQRINFYKTKEDTINNTKVRNITGWFKDAKIITKDLHFGRLIIFAKYNNEFSNYRSPVRFIEQLGHKMITSIEQWEALGFKVSEMEDFFGERLVFKDRDYRKSIYLGTEVKTGWWSSKMSYYGGITLSPSDFSKDLLKYIKETHDEVNSQMLTAYHSHYNNGEYRIEKELKKIAQDPEFLGIFHYKSNRGYGIRNYDRPMRWTFGTSHESISVRQHLMDVIREYNLDLLSLCKWLKRQVNIDRNDIGYLLGDGNHYGDYLLCEKDLCDGRLSKMNKYPDNFRSEFHRVQDEYNAKKADIDEAKFEKQAELNKYLEHTGRKFQIIIPKQTQEIHYEAQCLKHCVRTYIPRVVAGQTLILFLRDKKEPDEPLVTLEVKKGALTQAYGKNDRKPKKEHLDFLKMWCRMKNLRVGCWKGDLL